MAECSDDKEGVVCDEKMVHQLETGTKLISLVNQPAFVFASLWPSWFFAARSAGYASLVVCVEDVKPGVDVAIKSVMSEHDKWLDWGRWREELLHQLKAQKEQLLVLIQGPRDAVNRVLEFLSTLGKGRKALFHILAFATSEGVGRRRARKRQKLLSDADMRPIATLTHANVGGVIDHGWSLESNVEQIWEDREQLERDTAVKASLQDYLSRTVGGNSTAAPVGNGTQPTQTVVWRRRNVQVMAESVFSLTGWVRRGLTIDELMDSYDVSVEDRNVMQQAVWKLKVAPFPLEFTQQIPVRVLLRCLEVLRKANKGFDDLVPEKKSWFSAKINSDQEIGKWESMLRASCSEGFANKSKLGVSDEVKRQAKNDDAVAAVENWNRRVCERLGVRYEESKHALALDKIRGLQLLWYRRYNGGVTRSFRKYMHIEYGKDWLVQMWKARKAKSTRKERETELVKDYDVGIDAISRAISSSFWEWEDGSTVFFWRWTKEHRRELRDGLRVWFRKASLPRYWGRQRWPEDMDHRDKLKGKVQKIVDRRYISAGQVQSLTSFFAVPKGVDDIRVVYDATKSGLNNAIWAPNFFLPTMSSVLQNADDETYYGDIDIGEMFLNYFLDPDVRPWAGVDVSALMPAISQNDKVADDKRTILRWDRSLMGVRSSPFNCVRAYLISEEIIKGDRREVSNPFRWHRVVLNLPGQSGYDPSKPWVYRYDDIGRSLAAFVLSYVDDLRTGSSKGREECERVTHVTGSKLNYLGEQDATRKRGEASQEPGAWAGSVIVSRKGEGLFVTISQEKWNKVKDILGRYQKIIGEEGAMKVDYRQLEKDTGFLVHVFMTYEHLRPYLKGFYLTLNEWRYNRDSNGWTYGKKDWESFAEACWEDGGRWEEWMNDRKSEQTKSAPTKVRVVPRFVEDVLVLEAMFRSPTPSLRLVRGFHIAKVVYGFGDASGAGFGSSWVDCGVTADELANRRVRYRFGRWGSDADGKSSNFRELCNLVNTLEQMAEGGELTGVELFLFTDNSTAEAAFHRGSSRSELLYELVKKVKVIEMLFLTRIHIIHVAGKRMIQQGTDGLSRGCLTDGVMIGREMASFVPLHRHALERSKDLLSWLQEAVGTEGDSVLEPLHAEDWYEKGHDIAGGTTNCDGVWTPSYRYGNFVWSPPPCVGEQCMEELRKARHKRQRSTHVFLCPRIMSYAWQRHLFRSADVVFQLPPGHPAWSTSQHEPLVIGLFFPFLCHEPWQLKDTKTILGMGRHLQRVCKTDPGASRLVLRELWQFTRRLANLPERVVSRMLQGDGSPKIPKAAS